MLEWGSGGSTVWLTARGQQVTSIETDPVWAAWVTSQAPGADVRIIPSTSPAYVAAALEFPPASLDLVIIDGPCADPASRVACARAAKHLLRPGGLVVLDDTNLDFLAPAVAVFTGWEAVYISGTKRDADGIWETGFFRNL